MTQLLVSLSPAGLRNIQRTLYPNDFTFIVGKERFFCPSFIADFLSPNISRLHAADATIQEFVIDIPDVSLIFSEFLSLSEGSSIQVTESNYKHLGSICCKLGNVELLNSIFHRFEGELTISNVSERLKALSEIDGNYEEELDFAASHFHEITEQSESTFENLNDSLVCEIISRCSLKLRNEDTLWRFLRTRSRKQNDSELENRIAPFLEFVKFEYLSFETMKEVISVISECLPSLNSAVWFCLESRLLLSVAPPKFCERYNSDSVFHCSVGNNPLSGIIAFLTQKYGGNLHDLGIVTVAVSSHPPNSTDRTIRKRVLDLTSTEHVWTNWDTSNQWLCYDFKTSWIRPTHYSIRSEPYTSRPQHWVIEGSVQGFEWIELDQRSNNTDLKTSLVTKVFSITNSVPVRQIRIRQTGPNHAGGHCLAFSAFELFGDFDESSH